MEATVTIIAGQASKDVPLNLPTVIGRSREAGLKVSNPMISRKHAELFENNGVLMIRDLGSLNGTKIGKLRVKEAPLPPEAEFLVGPFTFRVHYEYSGDLNALPPTVPDDRSGPAPAAASQPATSEASAATPAAPQASAVEPTQEEWEASPDAEPTDDIEFLGEAAPKDENSFFDELFDE